MTILQPQEKLEDVSVSVDAAYSHLRPQMPGFEQVLHDKECERRYA